MEVADGITMFDTLLWGQEGITASYLIGGTQPALVETGAQTSVGTLRAALERVGMGPEDLAWIVLTHVHLDHCGGTGDLASVFPRATVVVHTRGAPHLVDPARLIAGSAQVYGEHMPRYGGLTAVAEHRIMAVDGGARISLGGTRELVMVDAPGHARHQMAILDEATGTVMAGDALGVQLPGAGLYPAIPPPEFDLDQAIATLRTLAALEPETLLLGHFGPVDDPQEAIALATAQQSTAAEAAWQAWSSTGADGIDAAVAAALPLEDAVREPGALAMWERLGWAQNKVAGLARWAERRAAAAS
jgi:glyoxylase-like metal-dependent hydrolase (beta-lactamase superfamily II)